MSSIPKTTPDKARKRNAYTASKRKAKLKENL